MTTGKAFYAKQGNTYIIKLVGDIRYTMSCTLDDFINRLFEQDDYDDIVIDLNETQCIDSTSLGLLAKIANFMGERFDKKPTLISSNQDINQVLDSLGFDEIFHIREQSSRTVDTEYPLPVSEADKLTLSQRLIEAHSTLSDLNDANRERFRDVIDVLKGGSDKNN